MKKNASLTRNVSLTFYIFVFIFQRKSNRRQMNANIVVQEKFINIWNLSIIVENHVSLDIHLKLYPLST